MLASNLFAVYSDLGRQKYENSSYCPFVVEIEISVNNLQEYVYTSSLRLALLTDRLTGLLLTQIY